MGFGRRFGALRSFRFRLLVPISLCTVALAVLGTIQTTTATDAARDANRARVLASTVITTSRLAQEVEREKAETIGQRLRGPTAGLQLLTAQRQRTDAAVAEYRRAAESGLAAAPELRSTLDAAYRALDGLARARESALADPGQATVADQLYRTLSAALLAVADALPAQLDDTSLANTARAIAAVSAIGHYAAQERDQLRTIFASRSLPAAELASVAAVAGAGAERESEFRRAADAAQLAAYTSLVSGRDVDNAATYRAGVLGGGLTPDALRVDPDVWFIAQSGYIRRVGLAGLRLADNLDRAAAELAAAARTRAWVTAVGTGGAALLALVAAALLAVRTSRRLRQLREAALTTAWHDLPETISAITTGAPAHVPGVATRAIAAVPDEIGEVAEAFNVVSRTAVRLAGGQAELRLDMANTAEALSRRIRTLITRQLRLLDEFERTETDPVALERLFALDHLATRLRRAGENLLVLAGGEPGRVVTDAYWLADVVAAAASEIEQYQRVQVEPSDVAIAGPAVGDVVHLLAELLENATTFSDPATPVRVMAHRVGHDVVLRVIDAGIGITPERLTEINTRLVRPSTISSAAAGTMGLYVVAHLAARRGIRVRLASGSAGTIAEVGLPASALAPPSVRKAGLQPWNPPVAARESAVAPDLVPWFRRHRQLEAGPGPTPPASPAGSGSRTPTTATAPMALADPDLIRARLSAYADGMSSARRLRPTHTEKGPR